MSDKLQFVVFVNQYLPEYQSNSLPYQNDKLKFIGHFGALRDVF